MITLEDIDYLLSDSGRSAVEDNLEVDPVKVALSKKLERPALIASQVKYLRRAKRKLPSYFAARCIIPPLAFEQSSSEATAALKDYAGDTCVDLTCGLGVDSWYFSRSFREVIAVEMDETLCLTARANFRLLRSNNITVVGSSAEQFIETLTARGVHVDMVYADPDRRPDSNNGGGRKIRLDECTPDMVALMPALRRIADRVVIKCSPLFDVDEAFRLFPDCRVEVVSAGGECKELIIETGNDTPQEICACIAGKGRFRFPADEPKPGARSGFDPPYAMMVIPDVALRKARLTTRWSSEALPGSYTAPGESYVFVKGDAEVDPAAIPGRVFEISDVVPYQPKVLRRRLAGGDVKSADIYLHNFPFAAAKICRELGIREGGTAKMAFTTIEGRLWTVFLK